MEKTIDYFSTSNYMIICQIEALAAYGNKISALREDLLNYFNEFVESDAIVVGNSLEDLLAME